MYLYGRFTILIVTQQWSLEKIGQQAVDLKKLNL